MFKAPIGRVETLEQALRKDLQSIPLSEPSGDTADRMSQALHRIAAAMRQADAEAREQAKPFGEHGLTQWRRCS